MDVIKTQDIEFIISNIPKTYESPEFEKIILSVVIFCKRNSISLKMKKQLAYYVDYLISNSEKSEYVEDILFYIGCHFKIENEQFPFDYLL